MSSTLLFANKAYAADTDVEQIGIVSADTISATEEQTQDGLKPIEPRAIESSDSNDGQRVEFLYNPINPNWKYMRS